MKEGQRIARGILVTIMLTAGLQVSKPSEAQTPPPAVPPGIAETLDHMLFIPFVAPIEKNLGIIFPPSTPIEEEFYKSPKVIPIMESCNDDTVGRKVADSKVNISALDNWVFPGPGFRYFAVARRIEDLAEESKYAQFNMNGYREMIMKSDFSNASKNPLPPMQKDQEYVAALDTVGSDGHPSFDGPVTVFKAVGCPPKN